MAHKKQLEKEAAMRKTFDKLVKKKKYTVDWIMGEVARIYFLEKLTVEHIIYGQYEKRRLKKVDGEDTNHGKNKK